MKAVCRTTALAAACAAAVAAPAAAEIVFDLGDVVGGGLLFAADEKIFVASGPAVETAGSDDLLTAFVASLRVAQPTMGPITIVEPNGDTNGLIYDPGRDVSTVRIQTLRGRHVGHVAFEELSEGELTGLTTIRATFLGTPEPQPQLVPEPATWAIMLLGFGLLGAALRRARRRTITA